MGNVVHCKREPYDVYIGRPSKWGNPFTHIKDRHTRAQFVVSTRDEAVSQYRQLLNAQVVRGDITLEELAALDGKTLGCWCSPKACHGDVLVSAAAWAKRKLEESA